jgi:regulator of sigma E protease
MEIFKTLFIIAEVILLFNLLILVHELGHFWAARWRGLVADKFAIWFGRPLWSKKINGVEYRLGWIPAGGFVSIPQMAPMETIEGKSDTPPLPAAKPLDKIIVAAAGPAFSLGLAFVFAIMVWFLGRPVSEGELTTKIGFVLPDGPAAAAGLQAGDRILSVDGNPVTRFAGMGNVEESIIWNIMGSETPVIPVVVERDGEEQTFWVETVVPAQEGLGRRALRQIGIAPAMTPRVARVMRDSPAAEAGLRPGDLVLAVDGSPLLSMPALAGYLDSHAGGPITLTVERGDETLQKTVTPKIPVDGEKPRIGIEWDSRGKTVLIHPNPVAQVTGTLRTMWATISAVVAPSNEIGLQHLSGPVGIMRFYYMIFEAPDGWLVALWFSVFLNVNLAVLNLLPFPVLDGGHIVLSLIEAIRRKPINVRLLEFVQSAFAILLIGFMLYVTFFDVVELPWKRTPREAPAEMTFAPTPAPPDRAPAESAP